MKAATREGSPQNAPAVRHSRAMRIPAPVANSLPLFSNSNTPILRTPTCPCGGGCPRCAPVIQPKLKIGSPNDKYEQEADRVAEQVMRMPEPQCPECEEDEELVQAKEISISNLAITPDLESRLHTVRGGGQPLDASTRAFFEPRFDHDFSRVRMHTDARAADVAQAVNARAFTLKRDMVFGVGQYAPETTGGRWLLAHELVHVVQQGQNEGNKGMLQTNPEETMPVSITEAWAQGLDDKELEKQTRIVQNQLLMTNTSGPGYVTSLQNLQILEAEVERRSLGPVKKPENKEEALEFAKSLEIRYPKWREKIPACPCTVGDAKKNLEFHSPWIAACDTDYHPGADSGYRTENGYASVKGTSHGQQCCYDANGCLLKGQGAGTPDLWAPIGWEGVSNHLDYDVHTWKLLGWRVYNQYWKPNTGKDCKPCASKSSTTSKNH